MPDYIKRFDQMVQDLRAHPKVEVLTYKRFEPASAAYLDRLETAWGASFDESIRQFYSQTNGLQLRWILHSNQDFDAKIHRFSDEVLDWDYAAANFRPEDGCIMLLPIEQVLNYLFMKTEELSTQDALEVLGEHYTFADFHYRLRVFDLFSHYCNMAFWLPRQDKALVLMGDEQHLCFTDSRLTDFSSYLEFLLATKGHCQRRKQFYGKYKGYSMPKVNTPNAYWDQKQALNLDTLIFVQDFPLADRKGAGTSAINTKKMQAQAQKDKGLNETDFAQVKHQHVEFLNSGGIGGRWQTMLVRGVVFGVYLNAKSERGRQAILDMRRIPQDLDLQAIQLPYSSWCGVYARYQDFSDADLTGSLFTDAFLEKAIFVDANLQSVDFSRANLRGASFMNANLRGADFENCDLSEADFRGAILEGARFPGAKLDGVQR